MSATDPGDIDAADTARSVAERIEYDERSSVGFIPGGNTCRCRDCGYIFRGSPRALRCMPCADQLRTVCQQEREETAGLQEMVTGIPRQEVGVTNRQMDDIIRQALDVGRDRQEWREMGSPPGQRRAKKVKVSKEIVRVQDALTKPKRNINLD